MLDKTYNAARSEQRVYEAWEEGGCFRAGGRDDAGDTRPFAIVIPPPNVTGSLHMGHALNCTLQDILIRHERMRGRDTLWQPGTDHAGIATQMVVERMLDAEGLERRDLGRDAFIARVWDWKRQSGGLISRQLRRLGASADWSRERFTMDEGLSKAVLKVFVELHRQGLVYKDKRLVNWDPRLMTAISDLEVEQRQTEGKLWHLRYPLEGGGAVVVATTRPETMLGDTAVAVHPEDERYRHLVGRHAVLPLVGRRLAIVADEHVDPEQGTGAVKITPAHDFNDFEVGRRHGLAQIGVLDRAARLNDNAPEAYRGLDRFEARTRVVADLQALGLVDRIEDHVHTVPFGDRGGVPIEPFLTEQWYVDAATLARPAIEAVESGRTRFVPESWAKTYFEWLRNIQPWCISRQLWWGHRIPAWYGPDGELFVAHDEAEARAAACRHYGESVELERDPDVLDTWFSSALWPFSTLGWPETTPELARYYPTDVLITGFDIIFFWVARMMMMGLHFMDEVPFHTVYIHGLVRDGRGRKMSKSQGNVIDPLDMIDRYGADALRFALADLAAPGRDIKVSERRVEGYRNFATKLWNAARYCDMNGCVAGPGFEPASCALTVNRWIVGEMALLRRRLDAALGDYRFNDAARALYQASWNTFCDWYLEFTKPILAGADAAAARETRGATGWVLRQLLVMLHPFMPHVTEALWRQLGSGGEGEARRPALIVAPWPDYGDELVDAAASAEMDWVIRLVSLIRNTRAEVNVPAGARIVAVLKDLDGEARGRLARHEHLVLRLARLDAVRPAAAIPEGSAQAVFDGATLGLPLAGVIDLAAESRRLRGEIEKLDGEIGGLERKLSDAGFRAGAPEHVIDGTRERRDRARAARLRFEEALARLAAVRGRRDT